MYQDKKELLSRYAQKHKNQGPTSENTYIQKLPFITQKKPIPLFFRTHSPCNPNAVDWSV